LIAGGGNKLKHPSVAKRTGAVAYEDWQYEINLRDQPTSAATPGETSGDRSSQLVTAISPTSDRWNFHPQISPDGSRIAFQSTRSGAYEIWISNRAGGEARQLTQSKVYKSMARWSPDSRHLALTQRTTGNQSELVIVDVDSGSVSTIARGRSLIAPSWSHDGASVRIGGRLDEPKYENEQPTEPGSTIVEIGVNDRRVTALARGDAAIESADGSALYTADLTGARLLRQTRTDNDLRAEPVADRVTADQWPNWGVYDRGVYYVGYPDAGEPQLFMLEDGTTIAKPMTRLNEMAWPGVAVSRDGSRVIYAHADRRASNIGGLMLR
jgi:dipeptidyl aminopeptidase/acylaminoacyl peptidase